MSHPTHQQIKAVRKVLYDHSRLQQLRSHALQIGSLMNLDAGATLPPNDARVQAGTGPNWFYPDNGNIDALVSQAAQHCDAIAKLLLKTRHDLSSVDFPHADKQQLMTALAELAASWSKRGEMWTTPLPISSQQMDSLVAEMSNHNLQSLKAAGRAGRYLRDFSEFHLV